MVAGAAQDVPPLDLVDVGRVAAAHGVNGWLKIQPYSRQGDALRSTDAWWLAPEGGGALPWRVAVLACRMAGPWLLAKVAGVADRDAALALRGCAVRVPRDRFPAAADDEYYWVDLIGCLLWGRHDAEPVLLGRVDAVFDNGAHAVLEVEPGALSDAGAFEAAPGRGGKVLVPFVAAHVTHVDLQARRIDSDWPAGF